MRLQWTAKAQSDLVRLYEFLVPINPQAAAKTLRSLVAGPRRLLRHRRIGERLDQYAPREVRRLLIGRYAMRYEMQGDTITVLRLRHAREDR